MNLSQYSILLLTIYVLIVLVLALWSGHKASHQGYVIGNRNLGLFSTICSMLAGQFNGGGVFIIFTFGLTIGYGQFWFAMGFILGYIVLALCAKKVHYEGKIYGDVNVPDILARRVGRLTQNFTSFVVIGKALLFGTAQLLIAGTIIATIIGLPNIWGICLTAFLIGLYVAVGGYLTVIKTDILQWCLMFGIAMVIALFFPFPSFDIMTSEIIQTSENLKWGSLLFTLTLIISNADPWQRIQSSKTPIIAQKSLLLSSIIFMVFVILCIMVVKGSGLKAADNLTFFSLFENQALSPLVLSILGVFTLTAVMSTIDTQVQLFTSALAKNVLNIDIVKERKRFISVSRWSTVALLIFMALSASLVGNAMEFILKAFSFAYILAPIMVVSMIWGDTGDRFKDITCFIALLLGLVVYIYMYFNGYFTEMINNVIPAGVTLLICIMGILIHVIKNTVFFNKI